MSEQTTGIDARGYLAGWLDMVTHMTIADVKAIPDDKWTATYGGCARPANELLGDTITNLKWTAETIAGAESAAYNEMGSVSAACSDKAAAIVALAEASAALSAAIRGATDDQLNRVAMAPWQMPTPVMTLAHIAVSHVWYHDGQLNYIQGMLGDEKVHWME